MGVLGKTRAWVGKAIGGKPLRESIDFHFGLTGDGTGVDNDEHLFRSINQDNRIREVSTHRRERVSQIAWWLYLAYPIAKRGAEIKRDFIVAEGFKFRAEEPEVQKVLDDFWKDPVNRWDRKLGDRVLELSIFGEQFYPVFVNDQNGRVRMGVIDPLLVQTVITNPNNSQQPDWVVIKRHHQESFGSDSGIGQILQAVDSAVGTADHVSRNELIEDLYEKLEKDPHALRIVHVDENPESPTFGMRVGQVFFFPVNKASSASRGQSDFLPVIDWFEIHEQFLFGVHEAAELKTAHVWDVTVKGATADQIKELQRTLQGPVKKGVTRFHNESVEYKSISPELNTTDTREHGAMIKQHIAAGLGVPVTWLADPGKTGNKADVSDPGVPTTKNLRQRQKIVVDMVSELFDYAIDQAIIHKQLKPGTNRKFQVMAPQVWAVDSQRIANTLLTITQALMLAQQNDWLDSFEASVLWKFIADQLGVQLTPNAEIQRVNKSPDETGGGEFDELDADMERRLPELSAELGRELSVNQTLSVLGLLTKADVPDKLKVQVLVDVFGMSQEKAERLVKAAKKEDGNGQVGGERAANGVQGRPVSPASPTANVPAVQPAKGR